MPLSWNEIKHRASRFGADWKGETRETAERQTFWVEMSNYLWPTSPTDARRQAVEKSAQAVLAARAKFPDSTLADLYDPVTMPPVLVKAHADLGREGGTLLPQRPVPHRPLPCRIPLRPLRKPYRPAGYQRQSKARSESQNHAANRDFGASSMKVPPPLFQ